MASICRKCLQVLISSSTMLVDRLSAPECGFQEVISRLSEGRHGITKQKCRLDPSVRVARSDKGVKIIGQNAVNTTMYS